jgi:hypothetical protein
MIRCIDSLTGKAPAYNGLLPSVGQTAFAIPAQQGGAVTEWSCSMGLCFGKLILD